MIRHLNILGWKGATLFALALMVLVPTTASAETITFVNETKATVVIQLSTVVRGSVRRDRPYTLNPGDKVKIALAGDKLVHVYDARVPTRVLFKGTIGASLIDQGFTLQPDAATGTMTMDVIPPVAMPKP
jgi:hypothetical protein